jgi:GTP-binding protein EngB required for normal cell division
MALSRMRKQYLHRLTERFNGRLHRPAAAKIPEAPVSAPQASEDWKNAIPIKDIYPQLALRFFEAWQKDKQKKLHICLFGQPGAGKSSLINELTGRKLAKVGVATDTTREAQIIETDDVVYVDLPGYDTARFPSKGYFSRFDPLQYDLFLCVFSGKLTTADEEFFGRLSRLGRVCIFVRNKMDGLYSSFKSVEKLKADIRREVARQVGPQAPLVFTSCRRDWKTPAERGIPDLQRSIAEHLLPAQRDRYARHVKAYTEDALWAKRKAADREVRKYVMMAAANGINPVIGMDAAIDARILKEMYQGIRDAFSLGEWDLPPEGHMVSMVKKVAGGVTGERVAKVLSLLLRKKAGQRTARYLPVAGAAAAMGMNAGSMYYVGKQYVRTCFEFARRRLEAEIEWGTHDNGM